MGASVGPSRCAVTIYVPEATGAQTIANLRDNGRIAVTLSRAIDHRSIQLKGRSTNIRRSEEPDRGVQARYIELFAESLSLIGFPKGLIERANYLPSLAVEIEVTELYEQTPGPRAGTPLACWPWGRGSSASRRERRRTLKLCHSEGMMVSFSKDRCVSCAATKSSKRVPSRLAREGRSSDVAITARLDSRSSSFISAASSSCWRMASAASEGFVFATSGRMIAVRPRADAVRLAPGNVRGEDDSEVGRQIREALARQALRRRIHVASGAERHGAVAARGHSLARQLDVSRRALCG